MTDTIQINDTVASLNGLVNGYSQILAMAKEQLEQLDLSESDKEALARKTTEDAYFRRRAAGHLIDMITDPQYLNEEQQKSVECFMQAVATKAANLVTDELIERRLSDILQRKLDAMRNELMDRFDSQLTQRVEHRMEQKADEWRESFYQRDARDQVFKQILKACMGDRAVGALQDLAYERINQDNGTTTTN